MGWHALMAVAAVPSVLLIADALSTPAKVVVSPASPHVAQQASYSVSYAVGFREQTVADVRYRWLAGYRPVRLSIWYPAAAGGRPMTFGEYAAADERRSDDLPRLVRMLVSESVTDSTIAALRREPVRANRDVPPAAGRFPVVLLGGGIDSRAYYHDALAEALASHGFIAVSVASEDTAPATPLSFDTTAVAVLLHDLRIVLQTVNELPAADVSRVGLVAWSLSGVAMTLLAAENPAVKVLISLDSGLGYAYGAQLLAQMGRPDRAAEVPVLHIEARAPARVAVARDDALCHRSGGIVCLQTDVLRHAQMTALAGRLTVGPEHQRIQEAYRAVVETSRAILEHYVMGREDRTIALPIDTTLLRRASRP